MQIQPVFEGLVPDMREEVIKYLSPLDLLISRAVAKNWKEFFEAHPRWKTECVRSFGEKIFQRLMLFPEYEQLLHAEKLSYFRIYFLLRRNFFKFLETPPAIANSIFKASNPSYCLSNLIQITDPWKKYGDFLFIVDGALTTLSLHTHSARLVKKWDLRVLGQVWSFCFHPSGMFLGSIEEKIAWEGHPGIITLRGVGQIANPGWDIDKIDKITLENDLIVLMAKTAEKIYFIKIQPNEDKTFTSNSIADEPLHMIGSDAHFINSREALVALKDGGLSLLDLETETHKTLSTNEKDQLKLSNFHVVAICMLADRIIIGTEEKKLLWFERKSIDSDDIRLNLLDQFSDLIKGGIRQITPIGEFGFCVHYEVIGLLGDPRIYACPAFFTLKEECKNGTPLKSIRDPIWLENGSLVHLESGGIAQLEYSDNGWAALNTVLSPVRKFFDFLS